MFECLIKRKILGKVRRTYKGSSVARASGRDRTFPCSTTLIFEFVLLLAGFINQVEIDKYSGSTPQCTQRIASCGYYISDGTGQA